MAKFDNPNLPEPLLGYPPELMEGCEALLM